MKIVVIDGQGGRIGRLVTARLCKEQLPDCELYAIAPMQPQPLPCSKPGADFGATGENPVLVACRDADFIIGPLGILSADSLLGEVTPAMAVAVGQSHAQKLLLPVNRCNNHIIGTADLSVSQLIDETIKFLKKSL